MSSPDEHLVEAIVAIQILLSGNLHSSGLTDSPQAKHANRLHSMRGKTPCPSAPSTAMPDKAQVSGGALAQVEVATNPPPESRCLLNMLNSFMVVKVQLR